MLLLLILGLITYGGAQKQLVKIMVVVINVVINIINSHNNECQSNCHNITQEEESELLEGSESQNYG